MIPQMRDVDQDRMVIANHLMNDLTWKSASSSLIFRIVLATRPVARPRARTTATPRVPDLLDIL